MCMYTYIVVDVSCKVCDSKGMCLVRHGLEVMSIFAVLVVKFLQQGQVCTLKILNVIVMQWLEYITT